MLAQKNERDPYLIVKALMTNKSCTGNLGIIQVLCQIRPSFGLLRFDIKNR
jgi:hypothetical protein